MDRNSPIHPDRRSKVNADSASAVVIPVSFPYFETIHFLDITRS